MEDLLKNSDQLYYRKKKERVKIESDRVKYYCQGAKPTLSFRILGEASISPMPKPGNNPINLFLKRKEKSSEGEKRGST